MRILITGGFGFLGGRLAQYLARATGNEILLGSQSRRTPPPWLERTAVVRTEWESEESLAKICEGVDAIFHLAGMNASDSTSDPAGAVAFNGGATARLVDAAAKNRVGRFIYFSTAHVYASPLCGTITEATPPASQHPYATSHLAGEESVRAASAGGEIEGIVVRLSNAYGAPTDESANCWMLLVNDLCREAAATRRLTLRSSGLQRRDFIPIAEVCRAADHLLRLSALRIGEGLFNVGGEWSPTVWEMANLIQQRCEVSGGERPELVRALPQPGEVPGKLDYRIDAMRKTGFKPGTDRILEMDGLIERCREWFT